MTRLQVALVRLLGAMVALPAAAQLVDLDDELWQPEPEMGVQIERRDAGQFYDSELQRWFDADDTGAEPVADTGRMADTSVPGWEYNPATRLWHDTQRPGWAWDPMTGRWYNSDRPGQAYDMRTGRWYPTTPGGMYYDSDQQRWYFDPQVAAMRGQGREAVSYFDQEAGRWREEPVSWRYCDESGRYTGAYCTMEGQPINPSVLMGATPAPGSFAPGYEIGQPVGQSRRIFGGNVTLVSAPTELRPGPATVVVALDGGGAAQAQLSGYLYRPDDTTQGTPVRFTRQGNLLYGELEVPATGQWELALRVNRPGYADERVYYTLMAQR